MERTPGQRTEQAVYLSCAVLTLLRTEKTSRVVSRRSRPSLQRRPFSYFPEELTEDPEISYLSEERVHQDSQPVFGLALESLWPSPQVHTEGPHTRSLKSGRGGNVSTTERGTSCCPELFPPTQPLLNVTVPPYFQALGVTR